MARTHFSNMRSRTVVGVEDSNRLLRNELGTVYVSPSISQPSGGTILILMAMA